MSFIGNGGSNNLFSELPRVTPCNSLANTVQRMGGYCVEVEGARITGTGTVNIPVFKVHEQVGLLEQWAVITEITTLVNLTAMYADLWDGSTSVPLTKTTGANLSGLPVGTMFGKTGLASDAYEVQTGATPQLFENPSRTVEQPFKIGQTHGVDTFIRFNFTTTDAPVDFKMNIYFKWNPINGGYLELV